MSCCGKKPELPEEPPLVLHFFTNGHPYLLPYRLSGTKDDLHNFNMIGKNRAGELEYRGKRIFTMDGKLLTNLKGITHSYAFVLVHKTTCFEEGPYKQVYYEYIAPKVKSPKCRKNIKKQRKEPQGCCSCCQDNKKKNKKQQKKAKKTKKKPVVKAKAQKQVRIGKLPKSHYRRKREVNGCCPSCCGKKKSCSKDQKKLMKPKKSRQKVGCWQKFVNWFCCCCRKPKRTKHCLYSGDLTKVRKHNCVKENCHSSKSNLKRGPSENKKGVWR